MTGRGRPRKAESSKSDCAGGKTTPEERLRNGSTEEKQNGTTRETKPKEKGSTENTKAPVRGAKAKTSSTKQPVEETRKPQPQTPKGSIKATITKKCSSTAKLSEQFEEKTERTPPDAPKDTTKASSKKSSLKKSPADEDESPKKRTEAKIKLQPETPEPAAKARASRHVSRGNATADSTLLTTLEQLKIKMSDKSNAAEVINNLTENIIKHFKQNTLCFKEVEPLRTGSYYENLKISHPDEFDIMMCVAVDRVDVTPFGDDGAYYSVALKRGNSPLKKFQASTTLSANDMLNEFRDEVKKCVKPFGEWEMTKKKKGCPAVTMTTVVQSVTISLDVVLCLMIKSSWPPFTKEGFKIESWQGTKVKQKYKRTPYYLVPKYEGSGKVEHHGVLAKDIWRVSFSHVEKDILRDHGSEKTCCEKNGNRCCRKDCLKLLKHLLSLLKEMHSSLDKFYSYHAKTTLLHACCARTKDSDWMASNLSQCFQQLLDDFVGHLEKGILPNFFIPDQNLLSGPDQDSCNLLAKCIKEQRDNGFLIFKMPDL
ncbi:cyclic GMP-AMP synthase [Scophthalmus maximus]|uniref:cyclic GMP-AMP synthase n=1 Tax=Scophthalmus maximus TaxID=52904 RepID=UPI001FA93282|nr:cyclic GMP-AMP synthase [Scophthalmus maximus]